MSVFCAVIDSVSDSSHTEYQNSPTQAAKNGIKSMTQLQNLQVIRRGVDELIVEADLVRKLAKGKPLRVKAGFEPTARDLHLGPTVVPNTISQIQELGNHVCLLIAY